MSSSESGISDMEASTSAENVTDATPVDTQDDTVVQPEPEAEDEEELDISEEIPDPFSDDEEEGDDRNFLPLTMVTSITSMVNVEIEDDDEDEDERKEDENESIPIFVPSLSYLAQVQNIQTESFASALPRRCPASCRRRCWGRASPRTRSWSPGRPGSGWRTPPWRRWTGTCGS
jgi:hypothetical protein